MANGLAAANANLPDAPPVYRLGQTLSVFISYPVENQKIAQAIERALRNFHHIEPFLDRERIDEGSELTREIEGSLDGADYFVGIGPEANRGNFSWCGFELGYFLATTKGRPRKVLAIYNTDVPGQFRAYENVQVVSLDEKQTSELGARIYRIQDTQLYSFFLGLTEEVGRRFPPVRPAQYFQDAADWAEKSTREVTESYFSTLQEWVKSTWFPQKRLEVRTGSVAFWEKQLPKIPEAAKVILEATTCGVLDYGVPQELSNVAMTWSQMEEVVRTKTGGLNFTNMVADVILSALPYSAEALNDHFFLAPDGKSYRILLVMHRLYGNGNREFVLNLVETLHPISGEGDKETSILTAAIMLASKYRFLFLEQDSKYGISRIGQLIGGNNTVAVRQMLKDMDRVHNEGTREGLGDESALIRLFGPAEEFEVRAMFTDFWPPLLAMRDAAGAFLDAPGDATREAFAQRHKEFVEKSQRINKSFISLCLGRYQAIIESQPIR